MIFVLVVFILVFVFFAFFIGKNLSNICNFWFFKNFENVPAAVLVLIAFAMGMAFSILIAIIAKIRQNTSIEIETTRAEKTEKANRKRERLERKEKSLRKNKKSAGTVKPTNVNSTADNK